MARIIAVVNQKGGVGKTTTAVNIASIMASRGKKVLVVDVDPQGNSTLGLGFDKEEDADNAYHVLIGRARINDVIRRTFNENLSLLPSNIHLTAAEIDLVSEESRETRLKDALDTVRSGYDYIFIDSPPSLGLLTLNSLVASDSVLIPMQCEFYALDGLGQLLRTVALVKDSLNPGLEIEGVVITMYDSRTNLSVQVVDEIKKKFKNKVYDTMIPRNVKLSEAPSFGRPIDVYDKSSRGARSYERLVDEMLKTPAKKQEGEK